MTIAAVEAWHLAVPARLPDRRLAVRVVGDDGSAGVCVGYAPPGALQVLEEVLRPLLLGRDESIIGELSAEMMWAVRAFGRGGVTMAAISAVDVALWDLRARRAGTPLCRLLGAEGPAPDAALYGSGGRLEDRLESVVRELRDFAAAGFEAVMMKVGTSFGTEEQEDLRRVRAVRDSVDLPTALYVCADGAYGIEQAVHMAERFAEVGVALFDQPVPVADVGGLASVRSRSAIRVAGGAGEYEIEGLRRLVDVGAVDVLRPDLLRIGGLTGWLRAVAVAASADLPLMTSGAQLVSLHAACATAACEAVEVSAGQLELDRATYEDVPVPVRGRWAPFADRPGLGVRLRSRER